jgi:hypothetical protein
MSEDKPVIMEAVRRVQVVLILECMAVVQPILELEELL